MQFLCSLYRKISVVIKLPMKFLAVFNVFAVATELNKMIQFVWLEEFNKDSTYSVVVILFWLLDLNTIQK